MNNTMTPTQYDAYKLSVAQFLARNSVKPGLHSARTLPNGDSAEPFFSWRPCECCGCRLGGNRETYTFACQSAPAAKLDAFEADICQDCVYFLAYDHLDDQTMMEIEATA